MIKKNLAQTNSNETLLGKTPAINVFEKRASSFGRRGSKREDNNNTLLSVNNNNTNHHTSIISSDKPLVSDRQKLAASTAFPAYRKDRKSSSGNNESSACCHQEQDGNESDDASLMKRPATVDLPNIAGQRYSLINLDPVVRERNRSSLPDITKHDNNANATAAMNAKQQTKRSQLSDSTSNISGGEKIGDFRKFPIDKIDREYVEQNCEEGELGPVSYTYLMWLQENPQPVIKLRNHGLGTKSITILKGSLNNKIVKELDMAGNHLNDVGIDDLSMLLRGNMFITTLDLSGNLFSTKGVVAICGLLEANKTIENLCLSQNGLTDTDLELLCTRLEEPDNKLKTLDLSFNSFTPQAGVTIGNLLAANNTLMELDIQGNSLGPVGCWEVFNGLRFGSLQKLNVAANEISEDGIIYISKMQDLGEALQHLDLSDNFITKHGIEYFTSMLQNNKTLLVLKLDNNLIGTNGLIYLLRFLMNNQNSSLSQLYVKGTFADETVKSLCSTIKIEYNSSFILVGTEGMAGNHGVDTLTTLQLYLRNNKIIDTHLQYSEAVIGSQ
eukprot:gene10756-11906_t